MRPAIRPSQSIDWSVARAESDITPKGPLLLLQGDTSWCYSRSLVAPLLLPLHTPQSITHAAKPLLHPGQSPSALFCSIGRTDRYSRRIPQSSHTTPLVSFGWVNKDETCATGGVGVVGSTKVCEEFRRRPVKNEPARIRGVVQIVRKAGCGLCLRVRNEYSSELTLVAR